MKKENIKNLKTIVVKFLVIVSLISIGAFPILPTISFYNDIEESLDNNFEAASLDLDFTSSTFEFVNNLGMEPGDTASRDFVVENDGELSFEYSQQYANPTGDIDLCEALNLEVSDGATILYSGLLSAYTLDGAAALSSTSTQTFNYEVTLPLSADSSLRNKSCQFDIEARAWQVGGSYPIGFYDTEYLTSVITSGNWPPPTPTLASPADNTIAGIGSDWTANPVMDWNDVVWADPTLYYVYQSSLSNTTNPDGSFVTPSFTSGSLTTSEISAAGTPDGTYYWHVKACDTTWGCGDWSLIWTLTVDSTVQEANNGDVVINEIMWMGSTASTADEWIELRNMTASPIVLKNWFIENAGSGTGSIVITSGTIPANGYFLVANYSASNPSSSLAVEADYVTASFSLDNTGEQLTLKDAVGNSIDQTPNTSWAAGTNTSLKQSMERNSVVGNGTDIASWHSCIDAGCNDVTFWDVEADNYGTPKATNLSSNDPTDPLNILSAPASVSVEELLFTNIVSPEVLEESDTNLEIPEATQSSEIIEDPTSTEESIENEVVSTPQPTVVEMLIDENENL